VAKTLMEERMKEFSAGSRTKMKVRQAMSKQASADKAKSWIQ
jgi:ABC-type Na+ transport system ATPase subunit NatA